MKIILMFFIIGFAVIFVNCTSLQKENVENINIHIHKNLVKRYGDYRFVKRSDYCKNFSYSKSGLNSVVPPLAISTSNSSKTSYFYPIIDSSINYRLIYVEVLNSKKSFKIQEVYRAESNSSCVCQYAYLKGEMSPGISNRKYFYYNFKKHLDYSDVNRQKSFKNYVNEQKLQYQKTVSLEYNVPLVKSCQEGSDEDFWYTSRAYFYKDQQLRQYTVVD